MKQPDLIQFRISSIKQETAQARTYRLKLLNQDKLDYKPGQFLTFIINTERQELRRSYSILSLPGEETEITVKKVENGIISRYILQNWKEGATVYSLPPSGRFTLDPEKNARRDIFFFAAGSGIVPVLPMIRNLLQKEPLSCVHLIYSNRNENDSLFLREIELLADRFEALNLINFFSEPAYRIHERGHISNLTAEPLINKNIRFDKKNALFFLCGPFSYMRMLRFTIGLMQVEKENIRTENYIPEVMRTGQVHHKLLPAQAVQVNLPGESYIVQVDTGQNILNAALEKGLHLPYSCKGGVCGNCAVICKSGAVYMSVNEVLTDKDLQQGWVLTCTGYPEDNKVILDFTSQS